jgi:hypothetical protein
VHNESRETAHARNSSIEKNLSRDKATTTASAMTASATRLPGMAEGKLFGAVVGEVAQLAAGAVDGVVQVAIEPQRTLSRSPTFKGSPATPSAKSIMEALEKNGGDDDAAGRRKSLRKTAKLLVSNSLIVVLYLLLGMVVFAATQTKRCGTEDVTELAAANCTSPSEPGCSCTMQWTYTDSVYFSMVTISTVGYGDFSPDVDERHPFMLMFTLAYIICGLIIAFPRLTVSARRRASPCAVCS